MTSLIVFSPSYSLLQVRGLARLVGAAFSHSAVGTGIVNDQKLKVRMGLPQQAVNGLAQEFSRIIYSH